MVTLHLDDDVIRSLSDNELNILKYVYTHAEDIVHISIHEMAKQVSYSKNWQTRPMFPQPRFSASAKSWATPDFQNLNMPWLRPYAVLRPLLPRQSPRIWTRR